MRFIINELRYCLAAFALLVITTYSPRVSGESSPPQTADFKNLSTEDLEKRLAEIDSSLTKLAAFTMRNGVGRIGYQTPAAASPNQNEWIEIDLEKEHTIDQVILVPEIWRDTEAGLVADGFPITFQVRLGTIDDREGRIVASFTEKDELVPRIAPLVIDVNNVQASWVRVEASQLPPTIWNETWHRLKLSEILIFSGSRNIAIKQPVKVASPVDDYPVTVAPENLVDGFTPYEMDAATGKRSLAFISRPPADQRLAITLDLGKTLPINLIHIHRIDMNDSVPQAVRFDYGIPGTLTIEGANNSDFSDAILLDEFIKTSIYEVGPIMKRRFDQAECRFVRLTAKDPFIKPLQLDDSAHIGFSEIEIFSNGKNAARNSQITATFEPGLNQQRGFASLIDGRNFYGDILSDRVWLNQLAMRHDLETLRPRIVSELGLRYAKQKTALDRLRWIAVLLGAGIIIAILFDRLIRHRQMALVKQRLAADLHDELGANLHTIGLLSDLADDAKTPEELSQLHQRIRNETERSGSAVRRCTNMLEARGIYTGLEEDIPRAARRILGKLNHDFTLEGKQYLKKLDQQTGYDLFLFYKECLVNISRHSDATEFSTKLIGGDKHIQLTVSDNGIGLGENSGIPASLKRRASLLKAKISVDSFQNKGTAITVKIPYRKARRNYKL